MPDPYSKSHVTSGTPRRFPTLARELEATTGGDSELHLSMCQCVERRAKTFEAEYADTLPRTELDGVPVKSTRQAPAS